MSNANLDLLFSLRTNFIKSSEAGGGELYFLVGGYISVRGRFPTSNIGWGVLFSRVGQSAVSITQFLYNMYYLAPTDTKKSYPLFQTFL